MATNLQEVKVGRNTLVAGGQKDRYGTVLDDLQYEAKVVYNNPGDFAYAIQSLMGTAFPIEGKLEPLDIKRQEEVVDSHLRLSTAMLERAFLFGDRQLRNALLKGEQQ